MSVGHLLGGRQTLLPVLGSGQMEVPALVELTFQHQHKQNIETNECVLINIYVRGLSGL